MRWQVENEGDGESIGYTVDAFAGTDGLLAATRSLDYDAPSLVALDPRDGSVRWRGDVDPSPWPPVIGPERVYVLARDGTLSAFSRDGTRAWSRTVELASPPAVGHQRLFGVTATNLPAVVAFDPVTGDERWRTAVSYRACSVPAVTSRRVYVTVSDERQPATVVALDPETCDRRWERALSVIDDERAAPAVTSPSVVEDGLVVAVAGENFGDAGHGTFLLRW